MGPTTPQGQVLGAQRLMKTRGSDGESNLGASTRPGSPGWNQRRPGPLKNVLARFVSGLLLWWMLLGLPVTDRSRACELF